MLFRSLLLIGVLAGLPHAAAAQQREMFELFGGMIRSGISAAAQAEWQRLPQAEAGCVDEVLRQRGSSIDEMIRQGVSPFDASVGGIRNNCRNQALRSAPSFDCQRARSADEVAICSDQDLARLDRLISIGYQDLVGRIGESAARSVAGAFLSSRRACGSDQTCIRNVQLSTIRAFQQRGVIVPNADAALDLPRGATSMVSSPYVVDGLRLGGQVQIGTPTYSEYRCSPSEQYPAMTWCNRRRQERASRGPFSSINSILHSGDGTALYINRSLDPAFFTGNEALDNVRRLSMRFGEPRYIAAPNVRDAPRTLMAAWGGLALQPLDRQRLSEMAAGREIRAGILVDHIGNFQRSASMGLPVYRVTGGPGYVWSASWDQAGRGTLRFFAMDPSRLTPTFPETAAPPVFDLPSIATAEITNPTVTPSASVPSQTLELQPPPIPAAPSRNESSNAGDMGSNQPRFSTGDSHPIQPSPLAVLPQPPTNPSTTVDQKAPSDSIPAGIFRPDPALNSAPAPKSSVAVPPPAPSSGVAQKPQIAAAADKLAPERVVNPSAIVPQAPRGGPDTFQWVLLAVVTLLLGAVGFLLFERRQRNGSGDKIANVAADEAANTPPGPVDHDISSDIGAKPEGKLKPADIREIDTPLIATVKSMSATLNVDPPSDRLEGSIVADVRLQTDIVDHPSTSLIEHRHFGIGLLVGLVALSALLSAFIGPVGLIPAVVSIYLLPSIIAFKVRHHYAWALMVGNVVFGATGLGWLGFLVWALTGPRRSALDSMAQHTALGLSRGATHDRAGSMSDHELRSGWKMPVIQAELFSFGDGPAVETTDGIGVFFKNPVLGILRSGPDVSGNNSVRYNTATQIRCVAQIAAETKLRVSRTLGRTALTGIGAAILTGRQNALGAAFLDYRFAGDETDEIVVALIVFFDYSSIVIQSNDEEFQKFCSLLPPHVLSDEVQTRTAEEIDRIRRMAADGYRVIDEMKCEISATENSIAKFDDQARNGTSFSDRDEGRQGLIQAEERLVNERAVLNAVERLIRLAGEYQSGRRIA